MSLKQKSLLISFGSALSIAVVMGVVIYTYLLSGFQTIENQRVERSIRTVNAAIIDKYHQLDSKLSDWAVWDDSYQFLSDHNAGFIKSNLSISSFQKLGVDEVLFIGKKGDLIYSFLAKTDAEEEDFPEDIYEHFATGSALTNFSDKNNNKNGVLRTEDGLLIFSAAEVLKSDGTGPSNGIMVFATYFDRKMIANIQDLTQFKTSFALWDDTSMPQDFKDIKLDKSQRETSHIKVIDEPTIAGYIFVEDVFRVPQAIVKVAIPRDITLQGKSSMKTIIAMLALLGLFGAGFNFLLMDKGVLVKVLSLSQELITISHVKSLTKRIKEVPTANSDEIDVLRHDVNIMLENIEKSENQLKVEVDKRESILELMNASVVMLDSKACVVQINKKGYEALGYSKEELIGVNWIENVIVPEERELMKNKFAEIMNSNMINNAYIENSLLTKNKNKVSYGWNNTIIRDIKGNIISTLSVGIDISDKKSQEHEKEIYTENLKRLNETMVGRELKMIELKKEISRLQEKINKG